jgi:putative phosphoribosyl transferase
MKFPSRNEAGRALVPKLAGMAQPELVYGIAKGGIVVAEPIAQEFKCRLVPVHVAKLLLPWNQEVCFGLVIHDGEVIMDEGFYRQMGLSYMDAQKIARTKLSEIRRSQQNVTVEGNQQPSPKNREVLVVDDGMASGLTMLGAVTWLVNQGAGRINIAVPVATQLAIDLVKQKVEAIASLFVSTNKVFSVSMYYTEFSVLGDRDVREAIKRNREFLNITKDTTL